MLRASGNPTTQAAVDTLALWGQAPVPTHLLVVPETIPFGDLRLFTMLHHASVASAMVFALRGEPAVAANLLVMAGAVSCGPSFAATPIGLADKPPFANDNASLGAV